MIRESACQFGPEGHLCGVLTAPSREVPPLAAMLLVSAGLTAKMGPYRLYTETARALARRGIATLRFDLGGIGNSEQVDFARPLPERTRDDIAAALSCLIERTRASRLLLGGLCSGAEDALRFAGRDSRIDGVFMIDPHAFRTPAWWLHHLASLRSLKVAAQSLLRDSGLPRALAPPDDAAARESEGELINYRYMAQDEAAELLGRIVGRGARAHYIYTADRVEHFNHARQVYRMFPGLVLWPNVSVDFLPQLEHTQFLAEDRQTIIDCIVSWAATVAARPEVEEEEPAAALAAAG